MAYILENIEITHSIIPNSATEEWLYIYIYILYLP